jgi:uncharacterized membrane protein (UPF0136 family)
MFAFLLLIGGLLYGAAAFAGSRVYMLAAIVFGAWLAVAAVRLVARTVARAGNRRGET